MNGPELRAILTAEGWTEQQGTAMTRRTGSGRLDSVTTWWNRGDEPVVLLVEDEWRVTEDDELASESAFLVREVAPDSIRRGGNPTPEIVAALSATIDPLVLLGDYIGNTFPGKIGIPAFDRCAIIGQVRDAIAKAVQS